MKFESSQFFISYTQRGIFIDSQLREVLCVDEGDPVEMKLIVKDEFCRVTYAIARSKENWNPEIEKQAYGNVWYSQAFVDKAKIIIDYVDWNNLFFDWDIKSLLNTSFTIDVKKCSEIKPCEKLMLKLTSPLPTKCTKKGDLIFEKPEVVSEKSDIILWYYTKESNKKPINLRRTGLERLPSLGVERKALLKRYGITTILQLISYPLEELTKIKGISIKQFEKWILASSKVLVPSAIPVSCKVFLTEPREQNLLVSESTEIEVLLPYYSQFFVKGHPKVESRLLHELNNSFGAFYNINMKQESTITLTSKDGDKEINIFGPWIIEMIGFKEKDKVEEFLEDLQICIESSFENWGEKDVLLLISPQERSIEADEVLNALVNKLAVQYSEPEQVLLQIRWGKKILIDSNVLIDGRLSSLIMRTMMDVEDHSAETPEIIVPNIVTYEIKSMLERLKAKNAENELVDF